MPKRKRDTAKSAKPAPRKKIKSTTTPKTVEASEEARDIILCEIEADDFDGTTLVLQDPSQPIGDTCFILDLPAEIRQHIWGYVVAVQRPLRPVQVGDHANVFVHGDHTYDWAYDDVGAFGKVRQSREAPLEVVGLARTCVAIWQDLRHGGIFYRINRFNFATFQDFVTYLAAIIPEARRALTEVDVMLSFFDSMRRWTMFVDQVRWMSRSLFTLLADCLSLRRLDCELTLLDGVPEPSMELLVTYIETFVDSVCCSNVSSRLDVCFRISCEQYNSLKIYSILGTDGQFWDDLGLDEMELPCALTKRGVKVYECAFLGVGRGEFDGPEGQDHLKRMAAAIDTYNNNNNNNNRAQSSSSPPINATKHQEQVRDLFQRTKLDIWGDGRGLGHGGKRPGTISSRTRSQANQSIVSKGRILRPREKYDGAGMLNWIPAYRLLNAAEKNLYPKLQSYPIVSDMVRGESVDDTMVRVCVKDGARGEFVVWEPFYNLMGENHHTWSAHFHSFFEHVVCGRITLDHPVEDVPHPLDLAIAHESMAGCKSSFIRHVVSVWRDRSPRAGG